MLFCPLFQRLCLVLCLVVALPLRGSAFPPQESSEDDALRRERLDLAEWLIHRELVDSASAVLAGLHAELKTTGQLSSPLGLRMRLIRARAYERGRRFSAAFAESMQVIAESKDLELPEIRARALLLTALIYEQQNKGQQTWRYLMRSRRLIRDHDLDLIRPEFFIRMASYHRLFGTKERALLYSRKALAAASRLQLENEQATAHVLLSMLYRQPFPDRSMRHLQRAAELQRRADSHVFSAVIAIHLGDLRSQAGAYGEALMYSDSALHHARAAGAGSGIRSYLGRIYDDRADVLRQLGRTDSAFHYMALGRGAALSEVDRSTAARIAEIEARFDGEQKLRLIEEKERELERVQRQKRFVDVLILSSIAALVVLLFFYLRLRRANDQLAAQSILIKDKNDRLNEALEEQELLRGELHHRIKNNLQVIIGLLDMQLDNLDDAQNREEIKRLTERVHSMSAIHDILYRETNVSRIPVDRFVKNLCHNFLHMSGHDHHCRFEFDLPDWSFSLDTLIPLGTMLNELLMNSCKHATDGERIMVVSIALYRQDERFVLICRDNGPGYPKEGTGSRRSTLGLQLLRGLSRQLAGWMETYTDEGAVTKIYFLPKNQVPTKEPSESQFRTKSGPLRT